MELYFSNPFESTSYLIGTTYSDTYFVQAFVSGFNNTLLIFNKENNSSITLALDLEFSTALYLIQNETIYVIIPSGIVKYNINDTENGFVSLNTLNQSTNVFLESNTILVQDSIYTLSGLYSSNATLKYTNSVMKIDLREKNLTIIGKPSLYVYPPSRLYHSMKPIKNLFYLFGGFNNGDYFQDMWTFDPDSVEWNALALIGKLPSPRHSHACDSNGDSYIIFGGTNAKQLLNDFFIFNAFTNIWTEIVPENNFYPSPRKGACMVYRMPIVYIYGGTSFNGPTNELWSYSFNYNKFELISYGIVAASYHYCQLQEDLLLIASNSDRSYGMIYNTTSNKWNQFNTTYLSASASVFLNTTLFTFGGYNSEKVQLLSSFIISQPSEVFPTDLIYNSGASCYYKSNLYFHNGQATINSSYYMTLQSASPIFGYFNLLNYNSQSGKERLCASGSYFDGIECKLCGPGSYSLGIGNLKCQLCEAGTFNNNFGSNSKKQCYPCAEGTITTRKGSVFCMQCPGDQYCPVGARSILMNKVTPTTESIQPLNFANANNQNIMLLIEVYSGLSISIIALIALLASKQIKLTRNLDAFVHQHNYRIGKFMKTKKTSIGTAFTLVFFSITIFLIINVTASYYLDNIIEIKALQPLPVLQSSVSLFQAQIQVTTTFIYYGDSCGNIDSTCGNEIIIDIQDVTYDSYEYTCTLDQFQSCVVTVTCQNCVLQSSGSIEIRLMETYSFASGIKVNVSSSSSIPESFSTVVSTIISDSNQIFIGSAESVFAFLMTPSLFISDSPQFASRATGYHVTLNSAPNYGSQSNSENLPIYTSLATKVQFIQSQSGLLTNRYLNSSALVLISNLLGSIGGVMSIIGFLMNVIEEKYNKIRKKIKKKKNFERIKMNLNTISLSFSQIFSEKNTQDAEWTGNFFSRENENSK